MDDRPAAPSDDVRSSVLEVLVLTDQPLALLGLRTLLSADRDVAIVGEAASLDHAVEKVAFLRPHVVLMFSGALRAQLSDGIQALRAAGPEVAVLVVGGRGRGRTLELAEAFAAGARGCVPDDVSSRVLISAMLVAVAGGSVLLPLDEDGAVATSTELQDAPPPPELMALTERERAVARLLAQGLSNREIAREMVLAETTVKKYVSQTMRKLGCTDRLRTGLLVYRLGQGSAPPANARNALCHRLLRPGRPHAVARTG